ncbi:hypothetical protein MKW98_026378, partial [Papaver atlanticum]
SKANVNSMYNFFNEHQNHNNTVQVLENFPVHYEPSRYVPYDLYIGQPLKNCQVSHFLFRLILS